jgi:hypothetical protein
MCTKHKVPFPVGVGPRWDSERTSPFVQPGLVEQPSRSGRVVQRPIRSTLGSETARIRLARLDRDPLLDGRQRVGLHQLSTCRRFLERLWLLRRFDHFDRTFELADVLERKSFAAPGLAAAHSPLFGTRLVVRQQPAFGVDHELHVKGPAEQPRRGPGIGDLARYVLK